MFFIFLNHNWFFFFFLIGIVYAIDMLKCGHVNTLDTRQKPYSSFLWNVINPIWKFRSSNLLPILWIHLHGGDYNSLHTHCTSIFWCTTTLPVLSRNPLIRSETPTLPHLLNFLQKISNRLCTRVTTHGSGIECERSITPTPPCFEGQQWQCQFGSRQQRCVELNGVSPCNWYRPFIPFVVAKTLL